MFCSQSKPAPVARERSATERAMDEAAEFAGELGAASRSAAAASWERGWEASLIAAREAVNARWGRCSRDGLPSWWSCCRGRAPYSQLADEVMA